MTKANPARRLNIELCINKGRKSIQGGTNIRIKDRQTQKQQQGQRGHLK